MSATGITRGRGFTRDGRPTTNETDVHFLLVDYPDYPRSWEVAVVLGGAPHLSTGQSPEGAFRTRRDAKAALMRWIATRSKEES